MCCHGCFVDVFPSCQQREERTDVSGKWTFLWLKYVECNPTLCICRVAYCNGPLSNYKLGLNMQCMCVCVCGENATCKLQVCVCVCVTCTVPRLWEFCVVMWVWLLWQMFGFEMPHDGVGLVFCTNTLMHNLCNMNAAPAGFLRFVLLKCAFYKTWHFITLWFAFGLHARADFNSSSD